MLVANALPKMDFEKKKDERKDEDNKGVEKQTHHSKDHSKGVMGSLKGQGPHEYVNLDDMDFIDNLDDVIDVNYVDENLEKFLQDEIGHWIKDKHGSAGMQSPKILEVLDILSKIPPKEKAVIFCTFTR